MQEIEKVLGHEEVIKHLQKAAGKIICYDIAV